MAKDITIQDYLINQITSLDTTIKRQKDALLGYASAEELSKCKEAADAIQRLREKQDKFVVDACKYMSVASVLEKVLPIANRHSVESAYRSYGGYHYDAPTVTLAEAALLRAEFGSGFNPHIKQ